MCDRFVSEEDVDWLIEQAKRAQKLEEENEQLKDDVNRMENEYIHGVKEQNKHYRGAIESMKSEIKYALHSHKSKDVKRFYLENAVRIADESLEVEE